LKTPKASLWLFSYHGAEDETWVSIIRELQLWGPDLNFHVKSGDANIDRARSKVASWFLREEKEEVLLIVDADNAWQRGGLLHVAKQALERKAVVGGIYSKRAFGQGMAFRPLRETAGEFVIGADNLIPSEFVGTGFIAIPRAILETLSRDLPVVSGDYQPFFMPFVLPGYENMEYPTDDQAFCARVREAGYKVYASTYPKVTHIGQYTYRLADSQLVPPPEKEFVIRLDGKVLAHA
jgi:cellulose synthase/poly-beta-1,6-N-acetylglucosamine synthase-like glycosyltransferase